MNDIPMYLKPISTPEDMVENKQDGNEEDMEMDDEVTKSRVSACSRRKQETLKRSRMRRS